MKLLEAKNIHFIGIGGIGVSSLAQILKSKGKTITGSDLCPSDITKSLKLSGIKVVENHNEKNVTKKHDLVVYSQAIPASNPELVKAKKLKIKCLLFSEALGELTQDYYTIAVCGSHGKSTTTAMIARIADKAHLSPTVVVGTKMKEFGNRNYKVGTSNYLIIEACEYKRSFLNFDPNILVVTNIELDHLDYYKNLADYKNAFSALAKKVPKEGSIIINKDDKNSVSAIKNVKAQLVTISEKTQKTDFFLHNNELLYKDSVQAGNKKVEHKIKLQPKIPGKFNILNAALAASVGFALNIENKKIEQALKGYKGSWRRMEYKTLKGYKCKFIDDYGHHPTEIEVTLNTIRETHPEAKILCVFQPHQYNRTKMLLKEFGPAFNAADEVVIPDIYKVRDTEADVKSVSVNTLVAEIKKHNKNAKNGQGIAKTVSFIKSHHKDYDLVVTMGAGDIGEIYKML